ncbi:MAG TPA: hypothetical protein VGC76_04510 [Pyrinomonadaceae bacterium]|jgi:hypothetical protein
MTNSDNKNEECIELFCKTVAELNSISLKQMEGLLNIAITAAESTNSSGHTTDATSFISELKKTAEELSRNARNQADEIYKNVKTALSAEPKHSFCEAVEQKLIIALENNLANQQQLNVTGDAILAKAASVILSPDAETK